MGERGSERRAARAAALLSLGHKSSLSILKLWPEGARADIPEIPNGHPAYQNLDFFEPPPPAKRKCVSEFTPKSRRTLQRTLVTMKRAEVSYTMAMTLPGGEDADILPHDSVIDSFKTPLRRLANVSPFKGVSGFWKCELQNRGALHYHLLIHRVARKLQQAKANAGKHRVNSKIMEKTGFKLTEMRLFRLRSGYDVQGYRTPFSAVYLACYKESCKYEGVRPGKFQFRGAGSLQDFIDEDLGKAIPYGIYDPSHNLGWVSVGTDHDTAQFAVHSIGRWWVWKWYFRPRPFRHRLIRLTRRSPKQQRRQYLGW